MSPLNDVAATQGQLIVDGPHWSAELTLYDGTLQQIGRGVGRLEETLTPGLYQVETFLAGETESQIVAVRANQRTILTPDSWDIKFASAAPLSHTWTSDDHQQEAAVEISHHITWQRPEGGDSRLFVFVRTLEKQAHPQFADGLSLLAGDGQPVTDFREGMVRDASRGWLACTVDLPAGPYLLRAGRRGVPVRHQSLWLTPSFETHIFIPARRWPDLAHLSASMAHWGVGFRPNSDEAIAAEVVLDGLHRGKNLAASQQMRLLMREKFENPWLGILAAHAMLLSPESERQWYDIVIRNLGHMIGGHPDLRALALKRGPSPASEPFAHPPMLQASLRLVQGYSASHPEAVPLGSLTDRIFNDLLADSPWTAWRDPAKKTRAKRRVFRWTGAPSDMAYNRLEDLLLLSGFDLSSANISRWLDRLDPAEISRQLALPRGRVEKVIDALKEQPELFAMAEASSRTEQATLNYLQEKLLFEVSSYDSDA